MRIGSGREDAVDDTIARSQNVKFAWRRGFFLHPLTTARPTRVVFFVAEFPTHPVRTGVTLVQDVLACLKRLALSFPLPCEILFLGVSQLCPDSEGIVIAPVSYGILPFLGRWL